MTQNKSLTDTAFKLWQQAGQAHWHEVSGHSMWPFLKPGDQVLVYPTAGKETEGALEAGDVVLIRYSDRILVHRIIRVHSSGLIETWGDFNIRPDPLVAREQILGKVIEFQRHNSRITMDGWRKMWGSAVVALRPMLTTTLRGVHSLRRVKNLLKS